MPLTVAAAAAFEDAAERGGAYAEYDVDAAGRARAGCADDAAASDEAAVGDGREEGATATTAKSGSPASTAQREGGGAGDDDALSAKGHPLHEQGEGAEDAGGEEDAGAAAGREPLSELDRSIAQQRQQLQAERERLRQRRNSRMSAPTSGVASEQLEALRRREAESRAASASARFV